VAIREALNSIGVNFVEETVNDITLYTPDFYLPELKLAIEINGNNHYYPYSTRFMNFTNARNKVMRHYGFQVANLSSTMIEGLLRTENKEGIKSLVQRIVDSNKPQ